MRGLLKDRDVEGVFDIILTCLQTEPWAEFWKALSIPVLSFQHVGLAIRAKDVDVWRLCQAEDLVLVTANRNRESADSLEATLQNENRPDCLPVFTLADPQRLKFSGAYVSLVTERLLERLLDIENYRGTGRNFLP